MYAQLRESLAGLTPSTTVGALRHLRSTRVSGTVVALGLTSLFTDISSEMVSAVLPLYFIVALRLSPLDYGVVDGVYQGASAVLRILGGYAADRWRRYKEVAGLGYLLSAVCKPALLLAGGSPAGLAAVMMVDRTGKGIRTAPRDALISLSSPPAELGLAFGVHRALDTCGAVLGPAVAFSLLALQPNGFDVVFVTSGCVAVIGLAVLGLFVESHPRTETLAQAPRVDWRAIRNLLRTPEFRALVFTGTVLSGATVGDGFLYLGLQKRLAFPSTMFPLLYVGTSLVYLVLAIPMGRLADRIGRRRVLLGGYGLLLMVYCLLLLPPLGLAQLAAALGLLGAYYAATDGVLMALGAAMLPTTLRSSGLAVLTTASGLARLCASIAFGALWTWSSAEKAAASFGVCLVLAIVTASWALRRPAARRRSDP